MIISSTQKYQLSIPDKYQVVGPSGLLHFEKPATGKSPKIYTVSDNTHFFYVGSTFQPMGARLRGAFYADGKNGYHGYPWRHHKGCLNLNIWIIDLQGMT